MENQNPMNLMEKTMKMKDLDESHLLMIMDGRLIGGYLPKMGKQICISCWPFGGVINPG